MVRTVTLIMATLSLVAASADPASAQNRGRGNGGGAIEDPQPTNGENGAGNSGSGLGAGNGGTGTGNGNGANGGGNGNGGGNDSGGTPVDPQPGSGNNGAGNAGNGNGAGNGGSGQGNGNGNGGNNGNGPGGGNNGNGGGNGGSNRLSLTVESNINFGRLLMIGAGEGTVLLDPVTGTRMVAGQLQDFGGFTVQGRATIVGARFRQIQINFPERIMMRDPTGGLAELRAFETNLPAFPTLDENGVLEFTFTGTLATDTMIGRGGNLRGTIPISVDYN